MFGSYQHDTQYIKNQMHPFLVSSVSRVSLACNDRESFTKEETFNHRLEKKCLVILDECFPTVWRNFGIHLTCKIRPRYVYLVDGSNESIKKGR